MWWTRPCASCFRSRPPRRWSTRTGWASSRHGFCSTRGCRTWGPPRAGARGGAGSGAVGGGWRGGGLGGAAGGGGGGDARRFAAKGRAVALVTAMVGGRPAVAYTDVPAGADTRVIELGKVKLERP